MRASWLLLLLAGCGRAPDEPSHAAPYPAPPGAPVPAPTFSREALAPPVGDAGAAEPAVPTTADPAALDEILAAAPRPSASASTAAADLDRGALIGTDTGTPADAGPGEAHPPPDPARTAKIRVGKVTAEPGMSSPAVERAARAQLYWALVQRCRDVDGGILPPEVVHMELHIDHEGYIVPATILAFAKEPRFADAARCMARELRATSFRMPAAARGTPMNVRTDVPSVD